MQANIDESENSQTHKEVAQMHQVVPPEPEYVNIDEA
jgi:hypothetical protein